MAASRHHATASASMSHPHTSGPGAALEEQPRQPPAAAAPVKHPRTGGEVDAVRKGALEASVGKETARLEEERIGSREDTREERRPRDRHVLEFRCERGSDVNKLPSAA